MHRTSTTLLALTVMVIQSCQSTKTENKADVLTSNIDSSAKPQDDYFEYANGGWIKKNPIPADQSSWGIGNLVIEENRNRLRKIAEDAAAAKGADGSTEQKIGDYWIVAMDSAKIEKDGLAPVQPYLAKINAVNDVKSLQTLFAEFDKMNINGPIGFYVAQDAKNSNVNALQLWQTGIGLPEREYYFKTDVATTNIRAAYTKHIARILTMIGEDSVKSVTAANNILAMETEMAKAHRRLEETRDPYLNYNKFAVTDLNKIAPTIDWANYMSVSGIAKTDSVIIGQPDYYKTAGKLLQTIPLDTWKAYAKYRLIDAFAATLPDAFGKEDFEFSKLFSGATERKVRWKRVISAEEIQWVKCWVNYMHSNTSTKKQNSVTAIWLKPFVQH
jgi:putative endopeptidase